MMTSRHLHRLVRASTKRKQQRLAPFSSSSFSVKPPTSTPVTTATSIPPPSATTPPHTPTIDIINPSPKVEPIPTTSTSPSTPISTPTPTPQAPSKGKAPPYEPTKGVTPVPESSSRPPFFFLLLAIPTTTLIYLYNDRELQVRINKDYPNFYKTLVKYMGFPYARTQTNLVSATTPTPTTNTTTTATKPVKTPVSTPVSTNVKTPVSSPSTAPAQPATHEPSIDEMRQALATLRDIEAREQARAGATTRMSRTSTTATAPASTSSVVRDEISTSQMIAKLNELRQVVAEQERTTHQTATLATPPTPTSQITLSSLNDAQTRIKQLENYIDELYPKWKTEVSDADTHLKTELEQQKKAFQAERDALITEHRDHLKHAQHEWEQHQQQVVAEALRDQEREHLSITKSLLEELSDVMQQSAAMEREERLQILSELRTRIQAFDRVLSLQSDYNHISHRVHRLSLALLSIDDVIHTPSAFTQQWEILNNIGADDPIIKVALESVPTIVRANGVIPLSTLQSHFTSVETAVRRAAYVPVTAQNTLGHAVGRLFAAITLREPELVEGDDDLAKLSRATYHLHQSKNLSACVAELESLSPATHHYVADWLEEAHDRLIVDQAIILLKARITQLALSLN